MVRQLNGRTAIVTGAASGIGRATMRLFASEGMHVVGVVREEAQARDIGGAALGDITAVVANVADVSQVERAVETAVDRLGRIDVLVNCAGIGFRANLVETTDTQYQEMFDVNVRAVFVACRALIPHMLGNGGGVVINVASSLAMKAARERAVYAATKSAIVALTRSITVDFGPQGIRANCVAPGTTQTPWIDRILAGAPNPDGLRAQMASRQAIGRLGEAGEIASVIRFLASDESSFVHGAVIAVDGGQTAW